jgi:uncharacterized protein YyaL (SSP411 family)
VACALAVISGAAFASSEQEARAVPAAPTSASPRFTNRLASSDSPYLLLHAHNPVDWYPWGPEAFEKARREDKPIFLSVGYSTCFWCHVAERTIYSNPDIAKLMNQWFVNVKVDREQRPDIDQIYMLATRVMSGNGGWPNNLFLTPDLRPFFAGSYFPPADDPVYGTGFPTILRAIHDSWTKERSKAMQVAAKVAEALQRVQQQPAAPAVADIKPETWMRAAGESLLAQFDSEHGGIGSGGGPKFPRSPDLALLLNDFRIHGDPAARSAVTSTLDAMAFGGVHDHLGGGFHRYSTEPTWSIPHFEKMLYDNAQLLQLYAESYELTSNALHRQTSYDIAHYLMREMTSPEAAGFFTAQDSQINGVEGADYLWTRAEITSILGDEPSKRFFAVYELVPMPAQSTPGVSEPRAHGAEKSGVLRIRLPIDRTLKQSGVADSAAMITSLTRERAKLLAVRNQRPQPSRDDKILVDLNGLAIRAFTVAGRALREPQFIAQAQTIAERIWALAYDPKTRALKHEIFRGRAHAEGFLQDYAHLGVAFLALGAATGNPLWRDRATLLGKIILERFAREDGSFAMTGDPRELLVPVTDEGDGDVPSGTSAAIDLLLQLAATSSADRQFAPAATRAVNHLSAALQQYPAEWASAVTALNVQAVPGRSQAPTMAVATNPLTQAQSGFHIPVTSDHVRVSAVTEATTRTDRVIVTATVDKGYHINANPASFDYLIPTSVKFPELQLPEVTYPPPVRFKTTFAPEALDVYTDTVKLVASFPKDALPKRGTIRGVVKAQACDERVCLPPSELPFAIASADR